MKRRSDGPDTWEEARRRIIGLGERSVRKSHFPELQKRLSELERFRTLLDHAQDMILMLDMQSGVVIDANGSARRRMAGLDAPGFGVPLADVLGRELADVLAGAAGEGWTMEARLDLVDRPECDVEVSLRGVTLKEGRFAIVVIRDIHIRKAYEAKILQQAHFDSLTGLPNRALFHDRLGQAMRGAERRGGKVALLFIDLDRFKQVNDSIGHRAGDELLCQVAERLSACVRAEDTVARLGGDEFTAILPGVHQAADAVQVAEKILDAVAPLFLVEGREVYLSASVGITLYPDDGTEVDVLMRNADGAMYKAKAAGRNGYCFFTPELDAAARSRLQTETALRHALGRGEFSLVYQPLVDLKTRTIRGAEALLRWTNPALGSPGPDTFIPLTEETGLIKSIGEWVLEEACAQAVRWADRFGAFRLAVNVSTRQIQDPAFPDMLARVVKGLPEAVTLELELTEGIFIEDDPRTQETLRCLKGLGVLLSLDDFGTGYSSLSYLKRFPIDTLKIDRLFVEDATIDEDTASLTRAILAMARSLRLDVVAEGIENEQHLRFLLRHGCPAGQGFLFSRPLPAHRLTGLLDAGLDIPGPRQCAGDDG